MAFTARVYRVLIASPADVAAERDIAVHAIQEWNDLHSAQRGITLLPLRWETHTTPELGERPQGIINRQVVDHCDALVGIFWTRHGSPTGVADSGTLEEIERVVAAKKPTMLYFSKAPQHPDLIDLQQLEKLRSFRKRIEQDGVVQSYSSIAEFRDLLGRHIETTVRQLAAAESDIDSDHRAAVNRPDIQVSFVPVADSLVKGDVMQVTTTPTIVEDFSSIPDYAPDPDVPNKEDSPTRPSVGKKNDERATLLLAGSGSSTFLGGAIVNRDFYREYAAYLRDTNAARPLALLIINKGGIGARDVFFELQFSSDTPFSVIDKNQLTFDEPKKTNSGYKLTKYAAEHKKAGGWSFSKDVGALQPQRQLKWEPDVYVAAWATCKIAVEVTIYADTFATPVARTLLIDWQVNSSVNRASDFVEVCNLL